MNPLFIIILLCIFIPLNVFSQISAAETAFDKTASVQWLGTPLRESLERFCEVQQIHFFLDRRIDPSLPVHLELTNQTVRQVFAGLTEKTETGYFLFDDTVYIGTKESAELLPLLLKKHLKETAAFPNKQKNILNKKTAFHLPFSGEPKPAISDLIKNNGLSLSILQNDDAEILPFDLWNKTDLPAMPFYKLLTVLLIGFDKDYETDGNTIRIIPVPHTLLSGDTANDTAVNDTVKTQTEKMQAENPPPEIIPSNIPQARRRLTLKVENQPLGAVLDVLSKRIGLNIEIDKDSLEKKNVLPEQLISFEVKNVAVSELFRAICKPLKLEYRINGETVVIK